MICFWIHFGRWSKEAKYLTENLGVPTLIWDSVVDCYPIVLKLQCPQCDIFHPCFINLTISTRIIVCPYAWQIRKMLQAQSLILQKKNLHWLLCCRAEAMICFVWISKYNCVKIKSTQSYCYVCLPLTTRLKR